MNNIRPCCCCA